MVLNGYLVIAIYHIGMLHSMKLSLFFLLLKYNPSPITMMSAAAPSEIPIGIILFFDFSSDVTADGISVLNPWIKS